MTVIVQKTDGNIPMAYELETGAVIVDNNGYVINGGNVVLNRLSPSGTINVTTTKTQGLNEANEFLLYRRYNTVDTAVELGGKLFIRSGAYAVDETVKFLNNTVIECETSSADQSGVTIYPNFTTGTVVQFGNSTQSFVGKISGMQVQAGSGDAVLCIDGYLFGEALFEKVSTIGGTTALQIEANSADFCFIDCQFGNNTKGTSSDPLVNLLGVDDGEFYGCRFETWNGYGVQADSNSNCVSFTDCVWDDNGSTSATAGVWLFATNFKFQGCSIHTTQSGSSCINIRSPAAQTICSACRFLGAGSGVNVTGVSDGGIATILMGCWFTNLGGIQYFVLSNATTARLTSCIFDTVVGATLRIIAYGDVRIEHCIGVNGLGFGITTPVVPASGTAYSNSVGYKVRIYFTAAGTVTQYTITDSHGNSETFTRSITVGDYIDLEEGDSITLTYSAAPSWKFYGM